MGDTADREISGGSDMFYLNETDSFIAYPDQGKETGAYWTCEAAISLDAYSACECKPVWPPACGPGEAVMIPIGAYPSKVQCQANCGQDPLSKCHECTTRVWYVGGSPNTEVLCENKDYYTGNTLHDCQQKCIIDLAPDQAEIALLKKYAGPEGPRGSSSGRMMRPQGPKNVQNKEMKLQDEKKMPTTYLDLDFLSHTITDIKNGHYAYLKQCNIKDDGPQPPVEEPKIFLHCATSGKEDKCKKLPLKVKVKKQKNKKSDKRGLRGDWD